MDDTDETQIKIYELEQRITQLEKLTVEHVHRITKLEELVVRHAEKHYLNECGFPMRDGVGKLKRYWRIR